MPRGRASRRGPARRAAGAVRAHAPACLVLATAAALGGCAGAVTVEPAPSATADACTSLVAGLPGSVAGRQARGTGGTAGTAAWGDPPVVLRCGTPLTSPSAEGCVNVEGVDWVVLAEDSGDVLLAAYGRVPGVEVEVPAEVPAADVLPDLTAAVGAVPQERACT